MFGRLIERHALGDAVLARNAPTSIALKVVAPCEFAAEKAAFVDAFQSSRPDRTRWWRPSTSSSAR